MEDLTISYDSAERICNFSVTEDEKEKVKDFVYKHFREVADGSPLNNAEVSPTKNHGISNMSDKQTLKAHCKIQQGAVFSGKILSFGCSVCKDNLTFSPNDLLKHFQAVHKGTLPTYPCDLCDFVTNEFSALQRHRIEHRNTLVTCELCNDNVQYSLLLLTRHYIMCHSTNGQFRCDWCEFTTVDAGTFVQHIHRHNERHWRCSKCRHVSLNEEDHQTHLKGHTGMFPFTCQICGYGAARSEYLKKHRATVHKDLTEKKTSWKTAEDSPGSSSTNLKLLFKMSSEPQEAQKTPKRNCFSGSLPIQNGTKLIRPELSLEEGHHFVDGYVAKKDTRCKSFLTTDQSAPVVLQDCENFSGSDAGSHTNTNGLTVLMVKNKISLPPNCTTKVMGFKMVDGKKHLVLKVIPTTKQDLSTQNSPTIDDGNLLPPNLVLDKSKDTVEKVQYSDCKSSTSHCWAVSPRSGSSFGSGQDNIMAVKVKIEEEETSISNVNPTLDTADVSRQTNLPENQTCAGTSQSKELFHVKNQSHLNKTSCTEILRCDNSLACDIYDSDTTSSNNSKISSPITLCTDKVTSLSSSNIIQQILLSKSNFKRTLENCRAVDDSLLSDGNEPFFENKMGNSALTSTDSPEKNGIILKNVGSPPLQSSSFGIREAGKATQKVANQEVFTFHNYSKEKFCTSLNIVQNLNCNSELPLDKKEHTWESSQLNLTLTESPDHSIGSTLDDVEVDECIASVDDQLTEENPDSVLQEFNIIKIEEENIPISSKQPQTNNSSTSVGNFVEEHSDTIINKQLHKDRKVSSNSCSDSLKATGLRILQLPETRQSVCLRATENQLAMPVQVKNIPGFKLITNSSNPQINVSYMKPRLERSSITSNAKVMGIPAARSVVAESRPTLVSALPPCVGTTSNHYFINSPGLKSPVLLSSTLGSMPKDKIAKPQSTCYLVQRSVPFVQTPGLKLASTQLPLKPRPVLAMPLRSTEKGNTRQAGRQAFLLRYVSTPKSGLILNNQETKTGTSCGQTSEGSGNKVIFKIVSPTSSLLKSGAPTSSSQPLFVTTRPQTQCFLVSSNKTNVTSSSGVKKLISVENTVQKEIKQLDVLQSKMDVKEQPREAEKVFRAPRPIRTPSQRKRRRKVLFDDLPKKVHKARRLSNKVQPEKEDIEFWRPIAKEVERTLRLSPFSSVQQIKCPRRYQPVVVLNHPDADIPEVANIMRVVNRYKGSVTKVALCQKTIKALSGLHAPRNDSSTKSPSTSDRTNDLRPRPIQSSVQERFLLKLKLRKKSKKKYEVVKTLGGCQQGSVMFDCWFCGRLFSNQEDWVGHGQRHLMEATRDWNKLF